MMALLSQAVWRAIAVAVALAALVGMYAVWTKHQRNIGRAEVRAEWQADRLNIAKQSHLIMTANAEKSGQLQAEADRQRGIANAENHALNLRVDELSKRLRNRPTRPSDIGAGSVPTVAGAGAAGPGDGACTGDKLYRDDSELLVRLSASADKLRIALRSCRAGRQADIEAVNVTK
jgi:hypothetical protein